MKPYTASVHGQEVVVDARLMRRGPVHLQQGDAGRASFGIRAFRLVLWAAFRLLFRVRVVGRAHLPRHPAIICFNHLGWAEPFVVLLSFPVEPRIYVIGQAHVSEVSGFRHWLMDRLQILIPVDVSKPFQALRTSESLFKRGGSLLISPEGHLGTREGDLQPLQLGAAHAAITVGVPIVPVGITGTRELWLRRTITVRVGPPLDPAAFPGATRARVTALTAALDQAMRALLPGDPAQPRFKPLRRLLTNLF